MKESPTTRERAIAIAFDAFDSGEFYTDLRRRVAFHTESQNGPNPALAAYLTEEVSGTLARLGFTARVIAALPAPRRRWLDGLSGVVIVAVLGLALLFVAGLLQAPLANLAESIAEPFSAALARPSPGALLSLLAPLLALYLAGAALLEG